MANVFITGATGLLGWNLVKELLKDESVIAYLLVRGNAKHSARERVFDLIKRDYVKSERKGIADRIEIIEGDIIYPDLGADRRRLKDLSNKIHKIYHCAAWCEFGVPLEKIRQVNVYGTRNLLDLALKWKKTNTFESFNYISTVGVAGKSGGVFFEKNLNIGQSFNNTYEQSKFEAEELMQAYKKNGLPITIFRPAIIVGDSVAGKVNVFQMFYQFLHFLSLELIQDIPLNKDMEYNITPVDYVAKAIAIVSSNSGNGKTYHVVNSKGVSFNFFLDIATDYFGFKKPKVVSARQYDYEKVFGFRKKILDVYLPYLIHKNITYDAKNFNIAVKGSGFAWPEVNKELLTQLFKYCSKVGYVKRKRMSRS